LHDILKHLAEELERASSCCFYGKIRKYYFQNKTKKIITNNKVDALFNWCISSQTPSRPRKEYHKKERYLTEWRKSHVWKIKVIKYKRKRIRSICSGGIAN